MFDRFELFTIFAKESVENVEVLKSRENPKLKVPRFLSSLKKAEGEEREKSDLSRCSRP